jgi:acyl-coenzyme A thioesterase PaaI-like protein
MKIFSTRPK